MIKGKQNRKYICNVYVKGVTHLYTKIHLKSGRQKISRKKWIKINCTLREKKEKMFKPTTKKTRTR